MKTLVYHTIYCVPSNVLCLSKSQKEGLEQSGFVGDTVATSVQCVLSQWLLCTTRDTATVGCGQAEGECKLLHIDHLIHTVFIQSHIYT